MSEKVVPRCPVCKQPMRLNHRVIMDILNGLIHEECGTDIPIKDKGTAEEMLNKYPMHFSNLKKRIK
ncbi:hypothetical protein ACQKP0_25635 [Heyndrickxia sp. NPDC080065]|uniref:hypothetical protein n=1 Tax=Heyndrickxia sp. NPDC080065 TaxID=3390568 RepID=UPI003CFF91C2